MQWSMKLRGLCAAGFVFAVWGCADRYDSSAEVTDTNTNWLKSCDDDTRCGGLNCLCGVCTVACERAQECAQFSDEATCVAPTQGQCSVSAVCGLRSDDSSEPQASCVGCDASAGITSTTTGTSAEEPASMTATNDSNDASNQSADASIDASTNNTVTVSSSAASTSESDGASDDAGTRSSSSDTTTLAEDCAQAVENMACSSEGTICGGPCTDECQFCNRLVCSSGAWQRQETFPAPCSSCGDALNCNTLDSYCTIENGTNYSCETYPNECASDHSCECLQAQIDGACTTDGTGVTLVTGMSEQCECDVWYTGSDWCKPYADTAPVEWTCNGQTQALESLNAECTVLATGAARWCCPTSFAPTCE